MTEIRREQYGSKLKMKKNAKRKEKEPSEIFINKLDFMSESLSSFQQLLRYEHATQYTL